MKDGNVHVYREKVCTSAVGMKSIFLIVFTMVPEEVEIVSEVNSKGCALTLEPVVEREKPGIKAKSKSWNWTRN